MTKIFKGKIVGNNLRYDFKHMPPSEFESSDVRFQGESPMVDEFHTFTVRGFYKIGSLVNIEVTILENIE